MDIANTADNRRRFRSQTSDNMDRWKAEMGRVREEKRREEERSTKKESLRSRKVAKHCGSPMICGSGGSKSRLAKAAGAEPSGQTGDEKLHAVVARSRFASQNKQNTPCSDHFWKLRCQKSARRCGAKHISKSKWSKHTMIGPLWKLTCGKIACRRGAKHISMSKCTKHTMFGPLLEVEMLKKCTPLWREAHFQVKSAKKWGGKEHFWTFRCRFTWQRRDSTTTTSTLQLQLQLLTTPTLRCTTLR